MVSYIRRSEKRLSSICANDCKYVPLSKQPKSGVIERFSDFVNNSKNLFAITGAGISTESGIRDYRSEGVGQYATSNDRPTQYIDFLKNAKKRRRYWARNFAGWPLFKEFQPNINHYILADMEKYGNLHWLVTQNVDSLHFKAGSRKVSELHGTTSK